MIRRLDTAQPDFDARLAELLAFESAQDPAVDADVAAILADVKARGDAALLEYTRRFDRLQVASAAALELTPADCKRALKRISAPARSALQTAVRRVREYHKKQVTSSWRYRASDGSELGQKVTALDRVGIYVPGGKAAYP